MTTLIAALIALSFHTVPIHTGYDCVAAYVCQPGNSRGVPAGCYDEGGVLVADWPCHLEVDQNGEASAVFGSSIVRR